MTKRVLVGLALFMVTAGLIFTASCAKKQVKSEPGVAPAGETEAERTAAEQEARARQKALEEQRLREERLREEANARTEGTEKEEFLNEHIYFEFDKSRLLPEAKEILKRKAKWLMAHPNVSVIIEGHCDERGTNEYNMALGDRRAQSANSYLVDLGISRQRLTTISYGEERPVNSGHNERAWAENRRDQLVIE
jgi:peptidoglycan-associated lipoprotein